MVRTCTPSETLALGNTVNMATAVISAKTWRGERRSEERRTAPNMVALRDATNPARTICRELPPLHI